MAPLQRNCNGRSPFVNPLHQITSFFSKTTSPKSLPKTNPNSVPATPRLKSGKITDSVIHSDSTPVAASRACASSSSPKSIPISNPNSVPAPPRLKSGKIPLLATGSVRPSIDSVVNSDSTPEAANGAYGGEVVGRRIKILSSLERSCNEGFILSFSKISGKHLVQYDDATEELLDLAVEKVEVAEPVIRKFRRLRRVYAVQDQDEDDSGGVASNLKHANDDKFDNRNSRLKRAKK